MSKHTLPPVLAERRAELEASLAEAKANLDHHSQAQERLRWEMNCIRCEIQGIDVASEAFADAITNLAERPPLLATSSTKRDTDQSERRPRRNIGHMVLDHLLARDGSFGTTTREISKALGLQQKQVDIALGSLGTNVKWVADMGGWFAAVSAPDAARSDDDNVDAAAE